jgi:hypothetical protein
LQLLLLAGKVLGFYRPTMMAGQSYTSGLSTMSSTLLVMMSSSLRRQTTNLAEVKDIEIGFLYGSPVTDLEPKAPWTLTRLLGHQHASTTRATLLPMLQTLHLSGTMPPTRD